VDGERRGDGQGQEAVMPSSSAVWLAQTGLTDELLLTSKEK